jgi:hypothetical protein
MLAQHYKFSLMMSQALFNQVLLSHIVESMDLLLPHSYLSALLGLFCAVISASNIMLTMLCPHAPCITILQISQTCPPWFSSWNTRM